ncbi:hypothetical protein EAF04_002077 [Stromatinia cepivora]|nr:hypothetical protein EAF04_002077 [Stromatinia cepivora]
MPPPLSSSEETLANVADDSNQELRSPAIEIEPETKQPKPLNLERSHASFLESLVAEPPSVPPSKRHRYCSESVDSFVTHWLESTSDTASASHRRIYCRSDSFLNFTSINYIPRRLTKLTSNMPYTQEDDWQIGSYAPRRDNDGHILPPTPTLYSVSSPPAARSFVSLPTAASSRGSLVEDPFYRVQNLACNHIFLQNNYPKQFPEHVNSLVNHIQRDRDSPGPTPQQIEEDEELQQLDMGTGEPAVENYFKNNIFPRTKASDNLMHIDKSPMSKHATPISSSIYKISNPCPDMLYGYRRTSAFPQQQQLQLCNLGNEMAVNSHDLLYPFFVIEFTADGPGTPGSLWVATNQCLGASASCINIAEKLSQQLRQCQDENITLLDTTAFSIAMNGTEARLYVSWKQDELDYYMQKLDSYLLQKPNDYIEFRKHVLNIIEWGKDKRLKEIQKSLDILLEENRESASKQMKSRTPSLSSSNSYNSDNN